MLLTTERLMLRPFEADDWADLIEYLSDPEVVRFEPYGVFSAEMCVREAEERARNSAFIAVCLTDTGKLIGNLYFCHLENGNYTMGYVFNRAYWRQGYATEAMKALLENAFRKGGAHRVQAECNPDNTRSVRLLERLHMRREGLLRQNIAFRYDAITGAPIWQDTLIFAVLREEWQP